MVQQLPISAASEIIKLYVQHIISCRICNLQLVAIGNFPTQLNTSICNAESSIVACFALFASHRTKMEKIFKRRQLLIVTAVFIHYNYISHPTATTPQHESFFAPVIDERQLFLPQMRRSPRKAKIIASL